MQRLSFDPSPENPRRECEQGSSYKAASVRGKAQSYPRNLPTVDEIFETKDDNSVSILLGSEKKGRKMRAAPIPTKRDVRYWKEKYDKAYRLLVQSKSILEAMQKKERKQRKQTHCQLDKMEMRVQWLKAEVEAEKRKRKEAERMAEEMLLQLALDETDTPVIEVDKQRPEAEEKSDQDSIATSEAVAIVQTDLIKPAASAVEVKALKERCALFKNTNDSLVDDMQVLSKRNCELEDELSFARRQLEVCSNAMVEQTQATKEMSLRCYERVKSLYDTIEEQKHCKRSDDVTALHKHVADVYSEVEELTKFTQHLKIQLNRAHRLTLGSKKVEESQPKPAETTPLSLSDKSISPPETPQPNHPPPETELCLLQQPEVFHGSPWEKVKLDHADVYKQLKVAPGMAQTDHWESDLDRAYADAISTACTEEEKAIAQGGYLLLKDPEEKEKYDRVLELLHNLKDGVAAEELCLKKSQIFKRKKLTCRPVMLSLSKDFSSFTLVYSEAGESPSRMLTLPLSDIAQVSDAQESLSTFKLSSADIERSLKIITKTDDVLLRVQDRGFRETFMFMLQQVSPQTSN